MKQLIIVGVWQFGYSSGTDTFCKYLSNDYQISYISFDQGNPKFKLDGVNTDYILEATNNRMIRKYKFIRKICEYISYAEKDVVVYMTYFRFCSLIPILFPFRKIIIDHRSGNVNVNSLNRSIKNSLMWLETIFFRHVAAISEELKIHLKLPKKTIVFPLGSDIISTSQKSFESLNLLYVGTLKGRYIEDTIYGIANFKGKYPSVSITYDIIGKGDKSKIVDEITKYNLVSDVKLHGFVPNGEIDKYYDECNIGVCYAPMTSFYMPQPFTKLYEYTLSGMAVISVKLSDSVRQVNNNNGVLCMDNAQSFSDALEQIYLNRDNFNSAAIRQEFSKSTWAEISKQFKKILDE